MKKQILALMACAAVLAPTTGFCMDESAGKAAVRRQARQNTDLALNQNDQITNEEFGNLTHLTDLQLHHCYNIFDEGLTKLTNLTYLLLDDCPGITDNGLATLTNLTGLKLGYTPNISEDGFAPLQNLTSVDLGFHLNHNIQDTGFLDEYDQLIHPNLQHLALSYAHSITDEARDQLQALGVRVEEYDYDLPDAHENDVPMLQDLPGFNDEF